MKTKLLVIASVIITITINLSAQESGTFTDSRDGKIYKTVTIGTQTWMAENLAFKSTCGCWAYGNDNHNVAAYGYLYDWATAIVAAPEGWHLPSKDEWQVMIDSLGGRVDAGAKLKVTDTLFWKSPNPGATNETGFSALPGGYRGKSGNYEDFRKIGYWWTSTEVNDTRALPEIMYYHNTDISSYEDSKSMGFSIRCIKD